MTLAGVPVRDEFVLELARSLRNVGFRETAEALGSTSLTGHRTIKQATDLMTNA